jgi:2,3-bisphosphoglycerate-dependent phosphoglycerate mutase
MYTKLYLIRHCQATGQEAGAILTPSGARQAEKVADLLKGAGIERVVASPFTRAVQSIEPLARRLHLEIELDPRLQERILSRDALPDWREHLRQTFDLPDLRFPGGESSREAMQRASAVVQDVLRQQPPTVTALVSHGNLSALLLNYFDETMGFSTWESMTTPDVFCIQFVEAGTAITRIWLPYE